MLNRVYSVNLNGTRTFPSSQLHPSGTEPFIFRAVDCCRHLEFFCYNFVKLLFRQISSNCLPTFSRLMLQFARLKTFMSHPICLNVKNYGLLDIRVCLYHARKFHLENSSAPART